MPSPSTSYTRENGDNDNGEGDRNNTEAAAPSALQQQHQILEQQQQQDDAAADFVVVVKETDNTADADAAANNDNDNEYVRLSPSKERQQESDATSGLPPPRQRRRRRLHPDKKKAAAEYKQVSPKEEEEEENEPTVIGGGGGQELGDNAAAEEEENNGDDIIMGEEDVYSSSYTYSYSNSSYWNWLCSTLCNNDYFRVIRKYRNFRYYLALDLFKNAGEWLVRVAGLIAVQDWSGGAGEALSHLAMATLVPKAVCAPLGGWLSDNYDRRRVMMVLDSVSGVAVLGYMVAVQLRSLPFFYAVTVIRSALASSYYPVAKGILPLLVPNNKHDLQYAVTMTSWTWASMAIIGGIIAGSIETVLGSAGCFILDSITCWLSVLLMGFGVKGTYNVSSSRRSNNSNNDGYDLSGGEGELNSGTSTSTKNLCCCWSSLWNGISTIFMYLVTCGFGPLVALKGTGSIILGPEDIVGVEFATVRYDDGTENEQASSFRMGLLFALIGLGNLMGPTIMNLCTDANKPRTLQRACWLSCIYQAIGWVLIALSPSFAWFLVATVIRTLGAGMIYTYSSLLLQSLSDKEMLGRVLSVEYTIYVLAHAFSASLSGYLLDDAGMSENGLSWFGAVMATVATVLLGLYHWSGQGAANPRFNNNNRDDEQTDGYDDNNPGIFLDKNSSSRKQQQRVAPPLSNGSHQDELELPVSSIIKDDTAEKLSNGEII